MGASWDFERVLVLAPHTDDGEIGAGGFLSKMNRAGVQKKYVAFSTCAQSVPEGFPPDILSREVRQATKCLGFEESDLEILDFPVRQFPAYRQEILEHLIVLRREFRPDVVLCPASYDVHQDHRVIHEEAVRAFKNCTLLGYELPWNCFEFRSDLVVELEEDNLSDKIRAIRCYESQRFRTYGDGTFLSKLAEVRGSQIGVALAESFQIVRWIWSAG